MASVRQTKQNGKRNGARTLPDVRGLDSWPLAADDPGHHPVVPRVRPPRVSAVIPVKNEARNIGWVLERIPALVDEIILVDGVSSDATVAIARTVAPETIVVTEPRPGKGQALQTGFASARGEIIVMLDGDGSMDPAEIGRFVGLLDNGYDLVRGSRFMPGGSSTDITPLRRLGNRGLVGAANLLFRSNFSDLCYGYCAFRRQYLSNLALTANGFEVETELILHAWTAGLRISEVASVESPRRTGRSNLHTFRDGRRVLKTLWRERFELPARRERDEALVPRLEQSP
jgi:glycosyltransferase involved in cell wall biosynthesis